MKKQSYIVIGLSDFGMHVVRSLALSSVELLVIDRDEKKLEEVADIVLNTVCADAANPDVLSQLGISEFDGAIVDAEKEQDLERKVLITMQLKDLGVPYIIVKAVNELEGRVLHKVGADRVLQPDREVGIRVANQIVRGNYFEAIELPPDYCITDFAVPPAWFDQSIRELEIRAKHGVTVLSIHRSEERYLNPAPDFVLQSGDIAILLGGVGETNQLRELYR